MTPEPGPRRPLGVLCALGFGALMLAGCAAQTPAPTPPSSTVTAATSPTPATETAARRPPAPPPEKVSAPAASDVIGWDAGKLARALGTATLIRRDVGAEIWQYRTADCVLFLFLYPKADRPEVHHLTVADGGDADACLVSVVRTRDAAKG